MKSSIAFPSFYIFNFAFLIGLSALGQPANNLRPGDSALMVDTNGALVAPTNFFAANSARLNAAVTGGGGSGSGFPLTTNVNGSLVTNILASSISNNAKLVPAGATYDNGVAWGYPQYTLAVNSNSTYFCYVPGNGSNNDQTPLFLGDLSGSLNASGIFIPLTNHIQLLANNPSTPVLSQVYLVTNFFSGNLGGNFYGYGILNLDPASVVPDAALSGNVQLKNRSLAVTAYNGNEHFLIFSNTGNGSTLSLVRLGTGGYSDINFETAPNLNSIFSGGATLYWAIGMGAPGAGAPYTQPYFESYVSKYSIWYVGSGQIFGGFRGYLGYGGGKGNWVWFADGTTNTPMVEWDRAAYILSNYCQANFSSNIVFKASTTIAPTPAQIGVNGVALWNSNGVLYGVISANGATIKSTTLLAQ